jgi:hypothetical protein
MLTLFASFVLLFFFIVVSVLDLHWGRVRITWGGRLSWGIDIVGRTSVLGL